MPEEGVESPGGGRNYRHTSNQLTRVLEIKLGSSENTAHVLNP